MKRPFVPLFISINVTIFIFKDIDFPLLGLYLGALYFIFIGLIFFYNRKIRTTFALLCLAFAMLFLLHFQNERRQYNHTITQFSPPGEYITVFAKVTSFPESGDKQMRCMIQTNRLRFQKKTVRCTLNLLLTINGAHRHLSKGDRIRINIRISRRRFSQNFFRNPMRSHLLSRKIHFFATCKSIQSITILSRHPFWRAIASIRSTVREMLEKQYPESANKPETGFLSAILIGDRSRLNPETKAHFLNAGIYHIVAISGTHIGIIAIFILFSCRKLGLKEIPALWLTMAATLFYMLISGSSISTQRATIMAGLLIFGRIIDQDNDHLNSLSFAGLIILTLNPLDILNTGYILTFSLSSGILLGRNLIVSTRKKGKGTAIFELFSASVAASLVSLPLSLYFFTRYSLFTLFSGILLVPMASIIIALTFLLIPFSLTPEYLHLPFVSLLTGLTGIFLDLVTFLVSPINWTIFRAAPTQFHLFFYYFIFIRLTLRPFKSGVVNKIFLAILILTTLYFLLPDQAYQPKQTEIYFLDVGHGDSTVVVFPDGKAMLIDGGGSHFRRYEIGKRIVHSFLVQKRIRISWIAISHFHPDHVRGIIEILPLCQPEEIWLSQKAEQNHYYQKLINTIGNRTRVLFIGTGFKRDGPNYHIRCLSPIKVYRASKVENNDSQVLKITCHHHQFLFTGDIESEREQKLVNSYGPMLKSDVLKVPHHGSGTSSSSNFLKRVKPKIAVFSLNENNRFGFPHRTVLKNFRVQQARLLFTSRHGGIKISAGKNTLKITVSK